MHFYDHTNSVVNMAMQTFRDLDRGQVYTTLPTAQLELILKTLVDSAGPQQNREAASGGVKTLEGIKAALRTGGIGAP